MILLLYRNTPPNIHTHTHAVFTVLGNPNLTLAPFWAWPRALPSGLKILPGSPFSPWKSKTGKDRSGLTHWLSDTHKPEAAKGGGSLGEQRCLYGRVYDQSPLR